MGEGVRECHDRGHEYGLPESAFYFLEALSRLSESNYIPTEQDILRSRAKTTGVVEIFFHYKVHSTYYLPEMSSMMTGSLLGPGVSLKEVFLILFFSSNS